MLFLKELTKFGLKGNKLQQTSGVENNLTEMQTAQKVMEGLASCLSDTVRGKKLCMLKRKKQDEIE